MKKIKENMFFFWLHLGIVLFLWASPFLFSWKITIALMILLGIQFLFTNNTCIITMAEFGTTHPRISFYNDLFRRLKIKVNEKRMDFTSTYIFPIITILIALIWQIVLKINPLFSF